MVGKIKHCIRAFLKRGTHLETLEKENVGYLKQNILFTKKISELEHQLAQMPDERNLMRNLMGGISLDVNVKENFLAGFSTEEIRDFNRFGFVLAEDKWWKLFIAHAINKQAANVIGNIPHDNNKDLFGAGVIDGIMLVRDEVDARKNAHLLENQPEDPYDKNRAILD